MTWGAGLGTLVPIQLGPNGEHHVMLVASDGFTNKSIKVPQLRNNYERTGFNTTKLTNTAGFGVTHDGSGDSTERHIAQPPFDVTSDQDVADILAFILAQSGGDLPPGGLTTINVPLGLDGQDTHAAVGRQLTLSSPTLSPADELTFNQVKDMAVAGKIGLIAKGLQDGVGRGWVLRGADRFDSDKLGEILDVQELLALAAPGAELTLTVVPVGTQARCGVDRDSDGFLDADELELGGDPIDPQVVPSQWVELGGALAGTHGLPKLLGKGLLLSDGEVSFVLAEALENAPIILIVGLSAVSVPFKGGLLVPSPDLLLFGMLTDGNGSAILGATLPPGLPSGMQLVLQEWIQDPAAVSGYAATPGIIATSP